MDLRVKLHLDDGMFINTFVVGVLDGHVDRALDELCLDVRAKVGRSVKNIAVWYLANDGHEPRQFVDYNGRKNFEHVRVTPASAPATPDEKQYDAPGYDVLAGAPVSHMRELRRTADWPKPSPASPAGTTTSGRVVTPARKQTILERKDLAHRLEQHGLVVYAASVSSWLAGAYALLEGV